MERAASASTPGKRERCGRPVRPQPRGLSHGLKSRRRSRAAAREVHTRTPRARAVPAMGGFRVTVDVGPEMAGDGSGAGCADRKSVV